MAEIVGKSSAATDDGNLLPNVSPAL
jgi:hypothetical protein